MGVSSFHLPFVQKGKEKMSRVRGERKRTGTAKMKTCLFPWWRCLSTTRDAYARVHAPADGDDMDGCDGTIASKREACDALFGLPRELWHMIWDHAAQPSQAHFVVARVCWSWRRVVLDLHQASGTRRMQRGAEACRILVARDAIDAGNADLLVWALCSACAIKPTPQACARLWDRLPATGSLACARVLRDVGPWPPECVPGCPCCYSHSSKASASDCRIARVMTATVANRHNDLFRALVRWDFASGVRWHRVVLSEAVTRGYTDILDVLVEERVFRTITSRVGMFPTCLAQLGDGRDAAWVEWAAHFDRPESIRWLVDHGIGTRADCDNALVVAARRGSINTVVWLCEREHLGRFADAFVAALIRKRIKTARAMMAHAAVAYVYAEIQGDTVPEAVARARTDSLPLCARAVPLLDALLALDKTNRA